MMVHIVEGKQNFKADIYSFGVMMLQLLMKVPVGSTPRKKQQYRGKSQAEEKHVTLRAREAMITKEHIVHKTFMSTGCSLQDAVSVTELALKCVTDHTNGRPPSMEEVVKKLEEYGEGEGVTDDKSI